MKLISEASSNDASARAAEWRPGVRVCLLLLRGYKILISPYFRGSCRFLPSCADYAAEAIDQHGVSRGIWLAARRWSKLSNTLPRSKYKNRGGIDAQSKRPWR